MRRCAYSCISMPASLHRSCSPRRARPRTAQRSSPRQFVQTAAADALTRPHPAGCVQGHEAPHLPHDVGPWPLRRRQQVRRISGLGACDDAARKHRNALSMLRGQPRGNDPRLRTRSLVERGAACRGARRAVKICPTIVGTRFQGWG